LLLIAGDGGIVVGGTVVLAELVAIVVAVVVAIVVAIVVINDDDYN